MWVLIAILVAAGPLLRGAWDLWAQTLLLLIAAAGTSVWLCAKVASGQVPAIPRTVLLWVGGLALLGGVAVGASPVAAYAAPEWHWRLGGLWVFAVVAGVSDEDRGRVDAAAHAAAWALVLVVAWQLLAEGRARPPASLLKENIFAGACLLLLPLAVQRRDYVLTAALAAAMLWTRSVGVWLALALAGILARPRGTSRALAIGLALVCAAAALAKFRAPAALDRFAWWGAAWRMFLEQPWTGWGPGAFAYLAPVFSKGGQVFTLYAHQSVLESLAETGFGYTVLLCGGLAWMLWAGRSWRTFGAAAVLLQSCWDLTLSIPAVYWLFCFCAGSSIRPAPRQVEVPRALRLPAIVLILGAGALLSKGLWDVWQADRLRVMARALLEDPPSPGRTRAAADLLAESIGLQDHPDSRILLAEAGLGLGAGPGALAEAAGELETAAGLNPYRAGTWKGLETVYRGLGDETAAADALRRGAAFCPSLRSP
ncbi:MAG: O-antigen ligase family protein [Elusimicrobia bacterium]|nr:O-antigen ligase family protein [Elusimicrobiota bacterium]